MVRLWIHFHGEGNRGVKENKVFSLGSYDGETMGGADSAKKMGVRGLNVLGEEESGVQGRQLGWKTYLNKA